MSGVFPFSRKYRTDGRKLDRLPVFIALGYVGFLLLSWAYIKHQLHSDNLPVGFVVVSEEPLVKHRIPHETLKAFLDEVERAPRHFGSHELFDSKCIIEVAKPVELHITLSRRRDGAIWIADLSSSGLLVNKCHSANFERFSALLNGSNAN